MDNEVKNKTEINERPGWGERIIYGAGNIGLRLVSMSISTFLLVYYTNVAMLDIAVISVIMAVSRFFDGVSDMLVGHVVDNTHSKLGKARVWLLRMCLPFALSTVLLFWVPAQWPEFVKYIYVFLMYNLVNSVFFTFMQISQLSLISLISDDKDEHGLLGNIFALARNIGAFLCTSQFVKLLGAFTSEPGNQNTQRAYTCSVAILSALMVVLTLATVFFTRERAAENYIPKGKRPGMLKVFSILLKGKYWRVILICELLALLSLQFTSSGATYYSMYVLNDMSAMSWLTASAMIPGIFMLLLTPFLIRIVGKHRLVIFGLVAVITGLVLCALVAPNASLMIPSLVLSGIGRSTFTAMIFGIVADIISVTKDETGQFIAGVGNAGLSAVDKIGLGLGSVIYGFVLSAAGFNAALDSQGIAQPASVVSAASFMFLWIPAILYAIVLVVYLLFFDMYKKDGEQNTLSKAE